MKKIPLRAYNREIEQLIAANRSQDALEHCQRIVERYPRCLETFRLMGKAYLELRQYDKAEEVFQKVLSFVPDDFTGNLGMSLLREKQTNLDGTIWHMERAYEAQPSNTAVQNELRRLYKQRDGVDSPRIRLTRGALVRMYLRGDLIPQAINEVQSILQEDPSRMDIRVLQASAFLKAGKTEEAFQTCQEILKELPYCYEANRILFENRASSLKIEEVQTLQQRLRDLDPYYEFTSQNQPDPEKVAPEEVQLEIPEDLGPKTATTNADQSQPFAAFDAFAQPLSSPEWETGEVEVKDSEADESISPAEIPTWMNDLQNPFFQNANENWNTGSAAGEIPITPNSGFEPGKLMTNEESFPQNELPNEPGTPPFPSSEDSEAAANPFLAVPGDAIPAAEPGDVPEWLKALASEPPAASSDAVTSPLRVPGETGVLQTGEENLDFLRGMPGEGTEPTKIDLPPASPAESHIDELAGVLPPSPFLTSSESTQPVPLEEGSEAAPPSRELPDWLRTAAEPAVETPSEPAAGTDFRQDFMAENLSPAPPAGESIAIENQPQKPEPEQTITAPVENNALPTPEIEQYLEQLRKDITPGDQPEWLKSDNLSNDLEALFDEKAKPSAASSQPASAEPDWMTQMKKEDVIPPSPSTAAATPAPAPTPPSVPNVPDWLFTPEDVEGETAPIQSDTPITHQPPPDWLAAARPDIFSRDFDQEETPQESAEKPASIQEGAFRAESLDLGASQVEPPVAETDIPAAEQAAPTLPEMDFLKSEPVDFINAIREPLEDNLESADLTDLSKEGLDFSKAVPVDSLPPDLAALLREETVSELTTNPLAEEPIPEFSLDATFPELTQKEPEIGFQPAAPETEKTGSAELSASEPVEQPEAISAATDVETTKVDQSVEDLFAATQQPVQSEEVAAPQEISAKLEPPTVPIDASLFAAIPPSVVEPAANAAEPFTESVPEEPKLAESAQVFEPFLDITPGKPAEQAVSPFQMESEVSETIAPVEAAPVEAAPFETEPVVEQPAAVEPPPLKQPAVSHAEKPVKPEPKQVKPVKPVAAPRPTHPVERPAPTPPSIQRKGTGTADLARAREAVTKGDIQTALRRYIKLVNSNKALEYVSNDLKELVRKNPKNFLVWQTFGDARLRANRIQEALDAYAKAADLLK